MPIETEKFAREKLNAQVVIKSGMGHFNTDAGIIEFPDLLEEILKK